jgi:hypothetical protein
MSLASTSAHLQTALGEIAANRVQMRRVVDACARPGDQHSAEQLASDANDDPVTLLRAAASAVQQRLPKNISADRFLPDGESQLAFGTTMFRDLDASAFRGDAVIARMAFRTADQSCLLWKRKERYFCPDNISSQREWSAEVYKQKSARVCVLLTLLVSTSGRDCNGMTAVQVTDRTSNTRLTLCARDIRSGCATNRSLPISYHGMRLRAHAQVTCQWACSVATTYACRARLRVVTRG